MRKREKERRKIPPTCFKCKKSWHMQFDCPENKKEKKVEKKWFKKSKKHVFSAWDVDDSSQSEEEQA